MLDLLLDLPASTYAWTAGLVLVAWAIRTRAWQPRQVLVLTVIDGDTLWTVDNAGKKRRLRLFGLDAPERGQPGYAQARLSLAQAIEGRWVDVRWRGRDRYRRHVASVSLEGVDPCRALIRQGLAYPLPEGRWSYLALWARVTGRGVWKTRLAPHTAWRRRSRLIGWTLWRWDRWRRKQHRRR